MSGSENAKRFGERRKDDMHSPVLFWPGVHGTLAPVARSPIKTMMDFMLAHRMAVQDSPWCVYIGFQHGSKRLGLRDLGHASRNLGALHISH